MKCVILAGGKGERLRPLTTAVNKHLLPVGGRPMIYQSLYLAKYLEFNQALVVTSPESVGPISKYISQEVADDQFDVYYAVQKEHLGIADALRYARYYAENDSVFLLLADNWFDKGFRKSFLQIKNEFQEADIGHVWITDNVEPGPYGYMKYAPHGPGVMDIVEKPNIRPSEDVVVGAYLLGISIWKWLKELEPSERGLSLIHI